MSPRGPRAGAAGPDRRAGAAAGDVREAELELERQRRVARAAAEEAEDRRLRAAAHAGGPLDPRAQGLWAAAAFHAARAGAAARRLEAAEALAGAIRARAQAARRSAGAAPEEEERPCA